MSPHACTAGLLFALAAVARAQPPAAHHVLDVMLDADRARLEIVDRIELPAAMIRGERVVVRINAGFDLRGVAGARIEAREAGRRVQARTLRLRERGDGVRIQCAGTPVLAARGEGPGEWLDARGAHLGHISAWYPRLRDALHAYELTLRLPQGWHGLVSGRVRPLSGEGWFARWWARPGAPVAVLAPGLREDVAAGYRAIARRVGAR